jgi:nicotinamidase/pyrazinamidase
MKDKLIFYEVDVQNDFMNGGGRLYVPDAELIKTNIGKLAEFAIENNIKRIRSRDRHFKDDEELKVFPEHCMDWQYGQIDGFDHHYYSGDLAIYGIDFIPKLATNMRRANVLQNKIGEGNQFKTYTKKEIKEIANDKEANIVIEKQHYDVFTNPAVKPILEAMNVKTAIVYGVATDYCVKAAVIGMQKLGIETFVLEDAIKGITAESSKQALDEMVCEGAEIIQLKYLEKVIKNVW